MCVTAWVVLAVLAALDEVLVTVMKYPLRLFW